MPERIPPFQPGRISARFQDGTIKPINLAGLLLARSILCFLAQAIFAFAFFLQGNATPWMASVPYWNVFGTLADIGCFFLLRFYLKKEGFTIPDLLQSPGTSRWKDLLIGIGLFLLVFPFAIIGMTVLANVLVYREIQPELGAGLLIDRQLPAWAMLYSIAVWWIIWSVIESAYYNGYLFPRIEVLTRRTWAAVVIVGTFWSLQHVFFPFIPDIRYIVWRFLQFIGIALLMPWIFSRLRRLRPLIITHWLMDFTGVLLTLKF